MSDQAHPGDPLELSSAAVAELQAQLAPLPPGSPVDTGNLESVSELPVEVVVELGRSTMSIGELLRLNVGSVVGVGTEVGAQLLIHVNGRPVWTGEALAVDDQLAVRVGGVVRGGGDRDVAA